MSIESRWGDDNPPQVAVTRENYARADGFLPKSVRKLMFGLKVEPHWSVDGDSFWYKIDTREGKRFKFVDPVEGIHEDAFDHIRLAATLSRVTDAVYAPLDLPFDRIAYAGKGEALLFTVENTRWRCDLDTYEVAIQDESKCRRDEVESPDGRWSAFVRDCNLYVRSLATGEEVQLASDGVEGYEYARPLSSPLDAAGLGEPEREPVVHWSPDSKKLFTYQIDQRNAGLLHLTQSVPTDDSSRPKCHPYIYPLPGDENVPRAEPVIFDLENRTQVRVAVKPLAMLYHGPPPRWVWWTKGDRPRLYLLRPERGFTALTLYEVDPETGASRLIVEERDSSGIDPRPAWFVEGGKEIVWLSQRDGWWHLYLYDGPTGELRNQITSGPWVVRDVKYVDEKERMIYFTAGGREADRDPYYRHLYRVKWDGSGLELLTPEDADHEVAFSPQGAYFVDTYSRVDLPPVTVLRRADGGMVRQLEAADIEGLSATGWMYPERFCVKARDGATGIYGVIFRPSSFDPGRKYPVIDGNYSGPHTIRAPKAFAGGDRGSSQFWQDQALAELGFVVVAIDGLGMAFRSKAFQEFSYGNLADGGLEDHIAALRQLAERYPYLDLERVGIYGYSAGGYSSTRAVLAYPDFFRVAVSWAGNHDHRTDKASWVERYMGLPVGEQYQDQANSSLAQNLEGKLFLMHGEMDENVPPAATLQLVDALIKANKDFDLLILPNGVHASGNHPYVTRKRWDYFVRHLLGATPPEGYTVKNS